jgi:glycosyltransferase involved in cell wall biosynthesis
MTTVPSTRARPPRVCIVAHFAYGAIAGAAGHIGGVEHQTTMLARWLAARGFDVTLIVWSEGQPPDVVIDGVRVLSVCRHDAGVRGVRFFHPRWTTLTRALAIADADLYYHNCAEYVTGQIALWCRRRGRRFVFSVASDPECDPRLPSLTTIRDRIFYKYGLTRADRIIVQTAAQARMLHDAFALESIVAPMPCPPPCAVRNMPAAGAFEPRRFIWVGRISPEKRLPLLLDIAEARPTLQFDVAGANDDSGYAQRLAERASTLPNVRLLGRVQRDCMGAVYQGATALLCTSEFEGFPNTFLEAWSCGIPVLSVIDPDGLLSNGGLGIAASDVVGLLAALDTLLQDRAGWDAMSRAARDYYVARHRPEVALPRFEQLFLEVLSSQSMPAGAVDRLNRPAEPAHRAPYAPHAGFGVTPRE